MKAKTDVEVESGIIELNHYWPHPMKGIEEESNLNLLYLYSIKPQSFCECTESTTHKYIEIKRNVKYFHNGLSKTFSDGQDTEECYTEFCKSLTERSTFSISEKFTCANCSFEYPSYVFESDLMNAGKYYIHDHKLNVYLNLEVAKALLGNTDASDSLCIKYLKLLRRGKLLRHYQLEENKTTSSRGLKRRSSYNLRKRDSNDENNTINWMKELEMGEETERNTIKKFRIQKLNDGSYTINSDLAIKLGTSGLYLNMRKDETEISTTAKVSKDKRMRVKTGLLTDLHDIDEGHRIIFDFIDSTRLDPEQKQSRTEIYKKKFPKHYVSNASLIICKRSNLKKWMTSIGKRCKNDKVIKITNSNDRKLFCSKDMNEADIILTTYEYLIKSPKSLGIRKRLVKKKGSIFFSTFKYRRVIYDGLSRSTVGLFKKFQKRGLELGSDFVWGIVDSKIELTKKFFGRETIKYLNLLKLSKNPLALIQFFNEKFIKDHDYKPRLLKLNEETVMVELNTKEKRDTKKESFLNWSKNKQLKECFNLQNDYSSYFKLSNLSRNLKRDTLYKIKRIEAEIEMEKELTDLDISDPQFDTKFKEKFPHLFKELNEAQSAYNFKETKLDQLLDPEIREKCPICHDFIPEEELGIYTCCHAFCVSCFKNCNLSSCPVCFKNGTINEVLNDPVAEELEKKHQHKILSSNSKLRKLSCYIKDLQVTAPSSRIVIYVKTAHQKRIVENMLDSLNCDRKTFNSVSEDTKVFVLAKSNLHLVGQLRHVTHFLILQPSYDENVKNTIFSENEGISKVTRGKSPLKVVRFVLKGTIEEKLFKETQEYREIIKNE